MLIEEHYKKNKNSLVKRYKRLLGDDVEDVIQETYARALKYYESFNQEKDFDKWFYTIFRNVISDFKADRGVVTVSVDPDTIEVSNDLPDRLSGRLNDKYLEGLDDKQTEVVVLYYRYNYKPSEISETTDYTTRGVWNILSKFNKRIKEEG